MLPEVIVLGHSVAMYGTMILIGVVLGAITALALAKRHSIKSEDVLFAFIYGIIGVVVGGKLLYLIVELPWILENFELLLSSPELIKHLLTGGFVFYGSLAGGLLMVYLYCKKYGLPLRDMAMAVIPAIPLMHAFGRMGCFFAGCCYGIEYSGIFAIVFKNSAIAPNGVPLFPVQILESIINLVIFGILLLFQTKNTSYKRVTVLYLVMYCISRFFLEFFRGDSVRGMLWGFSTSQWISMAVLAVLSYFLVTGRIHKKGAR